jgi:hypothetical protein
MTKISITRQFLEDVAALPKHLSKKALDLIRELERSQDAASLTSLSPGWRLHSLNNSPYLSASLDMNFRVLIHMSDTGNIILCRALKHDKAYTSGVLTQAIPSELGVDRDMISPSQLFGVLVALGVPQHAIGCLREVKTEEDLIETLAHIPEAFASLALDLYESELLQYTSTLYTAFDSGRDLLEHLREPLSEWQFYLHPAQRFVVDLPAHAHVVVSGSAGTGKTVCALFRAKNLVERGIPVTFVSLSRYTQQLFNSFFRDQAEIPRHLCPSNDREFLSILDNQGQACVVIDEAQDFPTSWFKALEQRLLSSSDVWFSLFADFNQRATPHGAKDADKKSIHALRVWTDIINSVAPIQICLPVNYRNSRSIAEYVRSNWESCLPVKYVTEISAFDANPVTELRGPKESSGAMVATTLRRMLGEYQADEIGLIGMGYFTAGIGVPFRVVESVRQAGLLLSAMDESPSSTNSIACGSPFAFKGHEKKAVVFFVPEDFTRSQFDSIRRAPYFYIGMTSTS